MERAISRVAVVSRHLSLIPPSITTAAGLSVVGAADEHEPIMLSLAQTAAATAAETGVGVATAPSDRPKPDDGRFVVRPLQIGDYQKGFYDVLAQLTTVGEVDEATFQARFQEIAARSDTYFVRVIEDTTTGRIVATATLVVERKFVHQSGMVGHIEDVVVDSKMRGFDLGRRIIDELMKLGKAAGCYKVILDCAEKNVGFYQKCGFERKEVMMAWYVPGRK